MERLEPIEATVNRVKLRYFHLKMGYYSVFIWDKNIEDFKYFGVFRHLEDVAKEVRFNECYRVRSR